MCSSRVGLAISVFRADPSPAEAVEALEPALAAGAMITIVGQCEVEYDGRASSYLPPGDRLVILKPDGTLLVLRVSMHEESAIGLENHEPITRREIARDRKSVV